ncbi:sialate O-acetylesterase [Calycomorphotria hydatis]|uniref:Sialate O-acetylesterase domain-containing protein n=1 Tax=Calycomorphotria hydatis TaxID=2528027 RepID=A0A517TCH1_9PLAN|nr:sialate O-acetylesterase [Calycomorphotria hydatis]QDT66060.1 hypothetical protein V22_33240 [Calycomorphotria hydatis]
MLGLRMITALMAGLLIGSLAEADVRLPAIWSDNMVLQVEKPVQIWGWAEPSEDVSVNVKLVDGDSATSLAQGKTQAGADGKWMLSLGQISADHLGGKCEVDVKGDNELTVSNVLLGDVWVCSGQSNMVWTVSNSNNAQEEIASAKYPEIRLFIVANKIAQEPVDDVSGEWKLCSPDSVPPFSAVGYFFGRELHQHLDRPIGLIKTCWGGTPAEAWTTHETLEKDFVSLMEASVKRDEYSKAQIPKYPETLKKWQEKVKQAKAEGKRAPRRPKDPDPMANPRRPAVLYNGMIHPLIPFPIKGAIWYQGESNAGRAAQYRTLFPAMIKDWRQLWGEDFPFLFVQLANFRQRSDNPYDSQWAELREAQSMTLSLPNTGMAVTIDIGEANDIHPRNKQDVGKRLALAARKVAYGEDDIVYSGPTYKSMEVRGNEVVLSFDNVGGGLVAEGGKLEGFAIAPVDGPFVWADAKIEGNTVVVSSPQVAEPSAVRYGWAENPPAPLYNTEGLPASPFRTDKRPGATDKNTGV